MISSRTLLTIAATAGFLSVAFGAFGAHGLPAHLEGKGLEIASIEKKVANFETGAQYLMYHALAILALAMSGLPQVSRIPNCAAGLFVIGMLLFSGGLFATSLSDWKIHAVIPIGGAFYLLGWLTLLSAACCGSSCKAVKSPSPAS